MYPTSPHHVKALTMNLIITDLVKKISKGLLYIYIWILLMCALRAHINFHFGKKISRELKK